MSDKHYLKAAALFGVVLATIGLSSSVRATGTVNPGWDLLVTDPVLTEFMGVHWTGVPLGTYDFGGGPVAVGKTDTIVQRMLPADAPTEAIPIELVALQLVSVIPINVGAGLALHYITLQSIRGGPDSPGRMTMNFGPEGNPHGTFDSFFDVWFDLRLGSLDGPIVLSEILPLSSQGTFWSHQAPPGALLLPGINHLLNGTDVFGDFWPEPILEQHPTGARHGAGPTPAPDAGGTLALLLGGCACLAGLRRRLTR